MDRCEPCEGTGLRIREDWRVCESCQGKGKA